MNAPAPQPPPSPAAEMVRAQMDFLYHPSHVERRKAWDTIQRLKAEEREAKKG